MTMTRTSHINLDLADAYDIWPVDDHRGDGGRWVIVVFRQGFSSMLSDEHGPMMWITEHTACVFIEAMAPGLARHKCDPGPRAELVD